MTIADIITNAVKAERLRREAAEPPEHQEEREREERRERRRALAEDIGRHLEFADEEDGVLTVSIATHPDYGGESEWWFGAAKLLAVCGQGHMLFTRKDGRRFRVICEEVQP